MWKTFPLTQLNRRTRGVSVIAEMQVTAFVVTNVCFCYKRIKQEEREEEGRGSKRKLPLKC